MEVVFVVIVAFIVLYTVYSFIHQRYTGPGEAADMRNVDEFGAPAKSLYTSTQVLTLHHRIEVTDEEGNVAYRAETQFPSIHDKTDIYAADGRHVAYMERKLITLHEIHYVDMDDGRSFTLSNELFHLIRDVTNVEGLGWILEGNFMQLNFTIRDEKGELIAVVSQKFLSLHDKYALDIYKPEYEDEAVAILITLQHMIRDRSNSGAAGAGAGSSAS